MCLKIKIREKGSTTLEYAILMPVVFACVLLAVYVFLILHQKALIQNLSEEAAQSLSRQWGYKPIPVDELESGAYKRSTYESREIYWHLKLWDKGSKQTNAQEYFNKKVKTTGLLKLYKPDYNKGKNMPKLSFDPDKPVYVEFKPGFPSTLIVKIKAAYTIPGAGILKLVGLGEYIVIEGNAQSQVYDAKDMINTTDYVVQIIRETKIYQEFIKKIEPLKENIDKFIKE